MIGGAWAAGRWNRGLVLIRMQPHIYIVSSEFCINTYLSTDPAVDTAFPSPKSTTSLFLSPEPETLLLTCVARMYGVIGLYSLYSG